MSKNFSIDELIASDTAKRKGIINTPSTEECENLLTLIDCCLQPIRDKIGKPMIITSGYRSKTLNRVVGGVGNSQHTKGQAADFVIKGMTPAQIIEKIKNSGIEFDQLINEYNQWVHISYKKYGNRKQVLKY